LPGCQHSALAGFFACSEADEDWRGAMITLNELSRSLRERS
jgi:hypothetical protein